MARVGSGARVLLILLLTFPAWPARPAEDRDVLTVTATVLSACSLSGGSLDFGPYTSGQTGDLNVNGTINYVNCTGTLTFALDGGGSGNINARQMSSGANRLGYQIYKDPARTAILGTGANALVQVLLVTQSSSVTIYGRIPAGQVVPEGTYTDTVNVTMTF